jgi:hypothetical protein
MPVAGAPSLGQQTPARAIMDDWDSRLLDLLDYICAFLGCGLSPDLAIEPAELQRRVELFITQATGDPPAGSTQSDLEAALSMIAEARWINGTQPLLPPWLAADLDATLADLEIRLKGVAATPSLEMP